MSEALDALWPHVSRARWFVGGPGAAPSGLRPLGWYPSPPGGPLVRSELLSVTLPDGGEDAYHLVLAYREEPGEGDLGAFEVDTPSGRRLMRARDAASDPQACSALLDCLRTGAQGPGFEFTCVDADRLASDLAPRTHGGEQSNTSVFLGRAAMLKVFRKLPEGRSLDIEVHEALADVPICAHLYGWWSGGGFDLGMLVEALPDPVDGFELACERARSGRDFAPEAARLGEALAQVHEALAARFPTGEISGAQLAATLTDRLDQAADELARLRPLRERVAGVYRALDDAPLPTQRVHGDFHLAQALLTPLGWRIVDFEGEPLKSPSERRALDSPWRDVAGMLRSLAYAANGGREIRWESDARDGFLRAYSGGMTDQVRRALRAYETDKAVYELIYETRSRPGLARIPLEHLSSLTTKE